MSITLFDAHFHIIDPRFPLVNNQGFLPDPFTCEDYLQQMDDANLIGGVVVSGSFQGFDLSYLLASLSQLGKQFVGVANISAQLPDDEISKLDRAGVRAVRFNLTRGGSEEISQMAYLSGKPHAEYRWHTEVYLPGKAIGLLKRKLMALPAVSIDHLGLTKDGLADLMELVETGVRVKATGFGRLDFDPLPVMQQVMKINPDALMFGTDLPSTRALRPFDKADIELVWDNFSKEDRDRILFKNAQKFYGR